MDSKSFDGLIPDKMGHENTHAAVSEILSEVIYPLVLLRSHQSMGYRGTSLDIARLAWQATSLWLSQQNSQTLKKWEKDRKEYPVYKRSGNVDWLRLYETSSPLQGTLPHICNMPCRTRLEKNAYGTTFFSAVAITSISEARHTGVCMDNCLTPFFESYFTMRERPEEKHLIALFPHGRSPFMPHASFAERVNALRLWVRNNRFHDGDEISIAELVPDERAKTWTMRQRVLSKNRDITQEHSTASHAYRRLIKEHGFLPNEERRRQQEQRLSVSQKLPALNDVHSLFGFNISNADAESHYLSHLVYALPRCSWRVHKNRPEQAITAMKIDQHIEEAKASFPQTTPPELEKVLEHGKGR
ncbi:MAG: hypothetical protein H6922_00675 [Pseudomonadaceae bacterium]|nr:hypothetical protein [Pseudomonadaceae bacterium]